MDDLKTGQSERKIINCHTHIFTGDHVPPYLARTFLPLGLYYLVPVKIVIQFFRFWYKYPNTFRFRFWYKRILRLIYSIKISITRSLILSILLSWLAGTLLFVYSFYILFDFFTSVIASIPSQNHWIEKVRDWLISHSILNLNIHVFWKACIVLLFLFFFTAGRNLIYFIFRQLFKFFRLLPGKHSKELISRYLNIGRYSFYRTQKGIFSRLKDQYPAGTGFVVLPMDMEFMDAGKPTASYVEQMQELAELKHSYPDQMYPFVFIDPRRIKMDPDFFSYRVNQGRVELEECFVKNYIEEKGFFGFKIYPALGYYPFDEHLLPLWKYAADNGIPIMTHCIRGSIFYRGRKNKEWDEHPIFKEAAGTDKYKPLLLPETKNAAFSNNFTHPLNYLCLLEERLLRKVINKSKNLRIKELFGSTDLNTELTSNLTQLKICFAHFGGEDQWNEFMESDRDIYSRQLISEPSRGIKFFDKPGEDEKKGRIEQIWKYTDWYSIICSIMLQYDHAYSDISYIIHDNNIHPLLKSTLQKENQRLRSRVLFGTDFYVVRNHKTERKMLADILSGLSEEEFNLIARKNSQNFLFGSSDMKTASKTAAIVPPIS